MHPRTLELLNYLTEARAELTRALASVSSDRRQQKPAPDQWSVAEVLEHLAIVEARIAAMVANDVAAARFAHLAPETSDRSVLSTMDIAGLKDRAQKRVASESAQPTGLLSADDAWARLQTTRADLESALRAGDGWALETLSRPHARLGELNLYQWIAFVGAHESRHAAQIVEVSQRLSTA